MKLFIFFLGTLNTFLGIFLSTIFYHSLIYFSNYSIQPSFDKLVSNGLLILVYLAVGLISIIRLLSKYDSKKTKYPLLVLSSILVVFYYVLFTNSAIQSFVLIPDIGIMDKFRNTGFKSAASYSILNFLEINNWLGK